MDAQIELHIFTNPVKKPVFHQTFESFVHTFGYIEPVVWCDGHIYLETLKDFDVRLTSGLADGYIRAIQESKADYLFMLEHDWQFLSIDDTLEDIVDLMKRNDLHHLRFNKRENKPAVWDKWIEDKGEYCLTPNVSNNPHIIERRIYLQFIKEGWIQRLGGSKGIEEIISKHIDGAIYGGEGHPATIKHLDGRG